jgi:hypothetical protein
MTEKNDKNKLALFDNIRKDITISDKKEVIVPVSYIFGKGSLSTIESFGGKTLKENSELVDKVLVRSSELENIWNRSHTQWTWKHLNLNYHAPMKNLRQISAELASKKSALNESKWKTLETEMKIRKLEEKLQTTNVEYWDEVEMKIELAKLREHLAEGMTYIEGAMKDVLMLNQLLDQLQDKVKDFSEIEVEKEETKSHLRRSIVQCIRDVRQHGSISKGEQEYAENIGVNPSKLQNIIRDYVETESQEESWDVQPLFEFVEKLSDELIDNCKVDEKLLSLQGFSNEPAEEYLYTKKITKS